ncbi:Asp23/Gls24 family envelope stress response protein [Arthrobacter sp. H14]|uniref:Asp23/Gls24 family envelope stress response protein n=1 Tax=Arthrobacter sp. H14 TaxID=1312959 RepID=UPI00047DACE6|nr:Asp23/Gls24 family envelope stress response protein [Arthrobacter sp. H14]
MPEQPITGRAVDNETLAEMLERTISEIPGVIRLEPTLWSTLARVQAASRRGLQKWIRPGSDAASTGRDGIHLQVADDGAQVTIELATDIAHSSVDTAKKVQQAATETIERAGLPTQRVDVVILSIESAP